MTGRVLAEDVRVPMRDGTVLAADVVRLDDGRRRPVMLVRTPYSRASVRAGHDPVALARTGWAVVLQDVRGRGDSGGTFAPFDQELADGADAVAWCAARPWSDGAVVMAGASYDGLTAWLAAESGAPALRAIAPTVSAPDTRDPWLRRGGALQLGFLLNWGLGLGLLGGGGDPAAASNGLRWLTGWRTTVRSPDAVDRLVAVFPPAARWFAPGGRPALAHPAEHGPVRSRGLPGYHVTGWYDIFVEGALAAYEQLRRTPAGGAQRLVVGPWTHGAVYGTAAGDVDFGHLASGADRFPGERLEFLRRAAAGEPVTGGAAVFVMGRDEWVEMPAWPPPSTEVELHLAPGHDPAGDGRLTPAPVTAATALTWQHDQHEPVPSRGGRTLHPALEVAGPVDRRDLAERADVLVFTGEPLPADLTVAGTVRARLLLRSGTPVTDVTAALVDAHPDGRALGVVDGLVRLETEVGAVHEVDLAVGSTAMTFRAGHRLRLEIASSNHPAHDPTPSGPRTLLLGGPAPSRLVLPVL